MENYKCKRVFIACWIFVFISFIEGKEKIPAKYLGLKHKGTVKTIVSYEEGDVIDCVDFYKQPSFDDPLIRDLQVDPDFYPSRAKTTNDDRYLGIYQNWRKYGECPNGTIPIRRAQNRNIHRKKRRHVTSTNDVEIHEYALVRQNLGKYHGGKADISLWNPKTEAHEFSLSQMWVETGTETTSEVNTIEAGWIVYPDIFGDSQTRFFIYWTRDNYNTTGCYDLDCPGFIQTSKDFVVGGPLGPVSTYNGTKHHITVAVYKDEKSGNWVLTLNENVLGYWPSSVFTSLAESAETVSWGGEVTNTEPQGHHTTTQMGSGHFPNEGLSKSSYFSALSVMDTTNTWVNVTGSKLFQHASVAACYDLRMQEPNTDFGTYFFYGGPGLSDQCK